MSYLKRYWTYILSFGIGIGLAALSWQLFVVPLYPTLIIDPNAPVLDDPFGIGYLPVELTGLPPEQGRVVKVCTVPKEYNNFIHNKPQGELNPFNPEGVVGRNVEWVSGGILFAGVGVIVGNVVRKNRKRKQNG